MDGFQHGFENRPPVTLICETPRVLRALQETADAAGGRVIHELNSEQAIRHFHYRRPTGTIIAEVERDATSDSLECLALACAQTRETGDALILSGPVECLDWLAPLGLESHVSWLCDPDLPERTAALALGLGAGQPGFADVSTELDQQRLRRLADEVSRIARSLANLSGTQTPGLAGPRMNDTALAFHAEPARLSETPMPSVDELRGLLRLRRMRDQFFDPSLFADPAWDILLDLMAARLEDAQVAVSSLCIAAAVPPTTALRWIKTMADHGLLERCADPGDGRRIFIRLADHAAVAMGRYFVAAKRVSNGPFGAI